MNCQLCQVLIIFLITLNSLDSARGFKGKGNRFLGQSKDTVDVFGEEYQNFDEYDPGDTNVEIDLHEKPNENEKVQKKIPLFRGTGKRNEVISFYDEFHGDEASNDSVMA